MMAKEMTKKKMMSLLVMLKSIKIMKIKKIMCMSLILESKKKAVGMRKINI
jgi:hypothetical protein